MFVYADNAATTPMDRRVVQVAEKYFYEAFGNPSSAHARGQQAKEALQESRKRLADSMNAYPEEIFFTSGGTEADNWALSQIDHGHIIISAQEHPAILNCAYRLKQCGVDVTLLNPNNKGFISEESLIQAIRPDTVLISIMTANNETGSIQPIKQLCKISHDHNILFHTDAVQSFCHIPTDVKDSDVDMLSISGHKFFGPKGTGALYIKKSVNVKPMIIGGGQENGLRSGTENVAGIAAMSFASSICTQNLNKDSIYIKKMTDYIRKSLSAIEHIHINSPEINCLYGTVNFGYEGILGDIIVQHLDMKGICVSSGSACHSGNPEPSHVLKSMGFDDMRAKEGVRISLSKYNNFKECKYICDTICQTIKNIINLRNK